MLRKKNTESKVFSPPQLYVHVSITLNIAF